MSRAQESNTARKYYKPIGGKFLLPTDAENEKAVRREITKDGVVIERWDIPHDYLFGTITGISFYEGQTNDGKKFKSLNVYLDPDEDTGEEPVVSMNVSSREAQDFLSRLPNVDLTKEVRLQAYEFKDKGSRGISIRQKDDDGNFTVKIENFFVESGAEGEPRKFHNGYPEPSEEDKKDWPYYFAGVAKFLQKYTEDNVIPSFAEKESRGFDYPEEEIDPTQVPF